MSTKLHCFVYKGKMHVCKYGDSKLVTEARDYGILRLIVSDTEKARQSLKDAGFTTHIAEAICVKVLDRPGELYKILDVLAGEKINVDYIYVIVYYYIFIIKIYYLIS